MKRWRRRRADPTGEADTAFDGLREMALDAVQRGLTAPSSEHPDVSGLVVDIPAQGGLATVVALTDRTTSMYTSTGGGMIGGGAHRAVAEANRRLLSMVQGHLGVFKRRSDGTAPEPGHVRFHVLTPSVRRYVDVTEDVFWGQVEDELTPIVASVQELISALRGVSPEEPRSPNTAQ